MSMGAMDGGPLDPDSLEAVFADAANIEPDPEAAARLEAEAAVAAVDAGSGTELETGEPGGGEAEPTGASPPPGPSPEQIAQTQALLKWMEDNPERATALLQAQAAQPTATAAPPELDLEDPTVKWLHDQVTEQRDAVKRLAAMTQQQVIDQGRRGVDEGISRFVASHPELSADEIKLVREARATVDTFPAYLAETRGDHATAAQKALEAGMWTVPAIREAAMKRAATPAQNELDARRQSKWGGVQGGQGGTRTNPSAMTPQEKQNAMVDEIRAIQNGTAV